MPHRNRILALATASAAVIGALLASGCQAQRRLVITSDPPGAEVRLDGRIIGVTPHEERFLHYGVRRVTLYKDGYLSYSEVVEIRGPWYTRFPVDFFSELLVPTGWEDRHEFHADLEPGRSKILTPVLDGVLARAERLRRSGPEGPVEEPDEEIEMEAPAEEETPPEGETEPAGSPGT